MITDKDPKGEDTPGTHTNMASEKTCTIYKLRTLFLRFSI